MKSLYYGALMVLCMAAVGHAQTAQPERQRTIGELQKELAITEGDYKQCKQSFAYWAEQAQLALQKAQALETENKELKAKVTQQEPAKVPEPAKPQ